MEGATTVGWAALQDAMREAEALLAAAAPTPETRAEGLGYLARLFASTLESTFSPEVRTVGGIYYGWMRFGGYNPDYIMGRALLDPKGVYRLAGRAHDVARLGVGVYTAGPQGLQLDDYVALDQLDVDPEGRFSVEIASGVSGRNRLALGPASNTLATRELMLRPGGRRPEVTLTRLDAPPAALSPEPTAAAADAKLNAAAAQVLLTLRRFLGWSEVIASRPNEMTQLAEELDRAVRGDPDTRYSSGYFHLEPHQALLIDLPEIECPYAMIQAVNHWLEPIAGANLNHTTWRADADGIVRAIVARRDPGRPNWLDVGGRRRGALFYRTVGVDVQVVPKARLVEIG